MPWFWTDDLARAAIEAGVVSEALVRPWIDRPAAVAAKPDDDPVTVAAGLLGIEEAAGAA